jgi:phosphatidylinositol alpha-1,6-mannosyltransferase
MLARPPISRLYQHALLQSHLICVSRYTAQVAAEVLPGVQITVVNNGVNAERYLALTHRDEKLRQQPPPLHNMEREARGGVKPPTILAVGAVKARKGILELVRALPAVRQEIPNAQCVIIGRLDDTGYVAQVRAEIERLNLANVVHLLGHVAEQTLLDWYAAADVFVLPSMNAGWKFEGYGLVHLEASAAGLPVIGTRDCGAEDAIDDGLTGLLVSQAQIAEELPAAIIRVLRDPALAAHMGTAGRAKARAQTWEHVAQQIITLYQETSCKP